MIDAAKFRADFPEFASAATYPDSIINFWIGIAAKRLNPLRWVDLIDFGTELFVAHHLILAAGNMKNGGKNAGQVAAPIASKTVDKVSITRDTSAIRMDDAGYWNATSYGIQFWQLTQMAGAGGVQV